MSKFEDKILEILTEAEQRYGTAIALCEASGVNNGNFSRWKRQVQSPRLKDLGKLMDFLGVNVSYDLGSPPVPAPKEKSVSFVQVRCSTEGAERPQGADFMAVPLVAEDDVGFSQIEKQKGWFMVPKNNANFSQRKGLVAIELGPRSSRMAPTILPGATVLIDRASCTIPNNSSLIMVIKEPDGATLIGRVSRTAIGDDTLISCYSDNPAVYQPKIFSLQKDYGGTWDFVVGQVVWTWQDVVQ